MGDMTTREAVPAAHPESSGRALSGLARSLTGLTSGALTYACVGATAGIFSLFAFSLSSSGPAFFWGWVIVAVSLGLMSLVWAELSSHFPFAGSLYQWPLQIAGRRAGWWVGWLYLGALLALLPAYVIVMPAVLTPLLGLEGSRGEVIGIAVGLIVVATLLNLFGIELLGRIAAIGVAAELTVFIGLSIVVYVLGPHQSPSLLFESGGTGSTFGDWLPGFIAGGMFVGLWALFMFETAGTLGEETIDAKRQAPRAILGAFAVTVLCGAFFLLLFILSIPDLGATMKSTTPIQDIITVELPSWVADAYLVMIAWTLLLATNGLFTAMCRHVFSMARDEQLPFSRALSMTNRNRSPWVAALVICVLTSLPIIIITSDLTVLVIGAIAAIYVPYVAALAVTLAARLRGWPARPAPFSLGRLGIPVNVAAVVLATATAVNLLWPRDATNPVWKLDIRVTYWLIGIPLLVGLVYYPLRQHRRLGTRAPEPQLAEQ
jgi:amino acid transporter